MINHFQLDGLTARSGSHHGLREDEEDERQPER